MGIRIKSHQVQATITPVGAAPMKTDQNTSYRTGDDGDLQEGRATDFFTLASNNPFGNTNRFTDELGGQTYTNDIVIDWSTYNNVAETVLGYTRNFVANGLDWDNSLDACLAYSVATFTSGWKMPNIRELLHIKSIDTGMTYSPFNLTPSVVIFSSTNNSTTCSIAGTSGGTNFSGNTTKTVITSRRAIAVRIFTVTGTTLS